MSDTATRYGFVSRFFHWIMALGFAWMLFTAISRFIDKDSALTKAIFYYHTQVGFTILWMAVLRILWGISQSKNRPKNDALVKAGHGVMYLLMLVVPALALGRAFGSDRGFSYFGITIFEPIGVKTEWLVNLGNALHGNLGWFFFLIIIGHIVMAIKHKLAGPEHNVLPRML